MPPRPCSRPSQALGLTGTGLTKRFGTFTALENVSLDVTPGSVHALLGENGAGKSTLVKCIMGYYAADAGTVAIDGRPADDRQPQGRAPRWAWAWSTSTSRWCRR